MKNIAIIGTGNLGKSVAQGILKNNLLKPEQVYCTRNKIEKLADLKEKGIHVLSDNIEATKNVEIVLLAVKPYKINDVLTEISPVLTENHIVVSLATGISLDAIQEKVNSTTKIFRAMPNTATSVEESITCLCTKSNDETAKSKIENIFNQIGQSIFISEELMNAATVIGACGIAYVLRFIRAMIQGGIEIGFDAKTANTIVTQTVKGAAELLITNGLHPEAEIDKVTTPKGCTIAGLNEMEHQGFSSALIKGIKTSYESI